LMELRASTYGDAQRMGAMLQGAADAAANIGPAMPAVVARFHLQMQRRFRDEGAGGPSGRWVALDPEGAAKMQCT
jgi:hypothetical protein